MTAFRTRAALALCTILAAAPLAAADRAGRATAVQQESFQATGAVGYPVEKHDEIFQQARVYTKQYGTLEIRLEDGTMLTVAPNASLVIDEYVFAGETRPGSLALSLSRGAMRMISGRMPNEGVSVTTQVATVGVRGTTIWVSAESDEETEVWVTEGVGTVSTRDGDELYEFAAPAHAICSSTGCVRGAEPPLPILNPIGGGSRFNEGRGAPSNLGESDGASRRN